MCTTQTYQISFSDDGAPEHTLIQVLHLIFMNDKVKGHCGLTSIYSIRTYEVLVFILLIHLRFVLFLIMRLWGGAVCAHECKCSQRPAEGVEFPGA